MNGVFQFVKAGGDVLTAVAVYPGSEQGGQRDSRRHYLNRDLGSVRHCQQMHELIIHDLGATDTTAQYAFIDNHPQRRRAGTLEDSLPLSASVDELVHLVVAIGRPPGQEQRPGIVRCLQQSGN